MWCLFKFWPFSLHFSRKCATKWQISLPYSLILHSGREKQLTRVAFIIDCTVGFHHNTIYLSIYLPCKVRSILGDLVLLRDTLTCCQGSQGLKPATFQILALPPELQWCVFCFNLNAQDNLYLKPTYYRLKQPHQLVINSREIGTESPQTGCGLLS